MIGETQRITIARAIVSQSSILILDEPTANLDAEAETEVMGALDKLVVGRTVLMITCQEGATVPANALYQRYNLWCNNGNMKPLNITNFGRMLGKKGIEKVHRNKGAIYQDIGLSEEA